MSEALSAEAIVALGHEAAMASEAMDKRVEKVLSRTSASQIQEYAHCARRWYNGYVLGHRVPPTNAMVRGTAIHAIVEHYLKGGAITAEVCRPLIVKAYEEAPHLEIDFDDATKQYMKMATSALEHLPQPNTPGVEVERWLEMPTFEGGPKFVGKYDAIEWERKPARVDDCKSTSDFRYVKSPEELAENIQLGAYAKHVIDETDDEYVDLRHIYIRTKGKAISMPVDKTVTSYQIQVRWEKTLGIVREMVAWAHARPASADDLPPNTESCELYGGCPYKPLCFDGGRAQVFNIKRSSEMSTNGATEQPQGSLIERLRKQQQELAAGKAPPAPAQAPALVAPPAPVVQAAPAPAPVPAAAAPVVQEAPPTITCPTCNGAKWMKSTDPSAPPGAFVSCKPCNGMGVVGAPAPAPVAAQAVLPPDAPPRTNQPGDEEAPKKRTRKKAGSIKVEQDDGTMKEVDPGSFQELDVPAPAGTTTTVQRVLPAGDTDHTLKEFVPAAQPKPPTPLKYPLPARRQLTLYIKALPSKGKHVGAIEMELWLEPLVRWVEENRTDDKGNPSPVIDWQIAPYNTIKGSLGAAIRATLDELPEAIVIENPFSPLSQVFLEAVTPIATEVIRGI